MDIKRFTYTNVDGYGDTRSRLVVEVIDHHVVYASETYTNEKAKSWERAYFVPGTKEFLYKDLSPECLNQFSKCYENSIPLKEKIHSQYDDCIDNYEVIGNYENPTYEAYADRRDKFLTEALSQEMDVFFHSSFTGDYGREVSKTIYILQDHVVREEELREIASGGYMEDWDIKNYYLPDSEFHLPNIDGELVEALKPFVRESLNRSWIHSKSNEFSIYGKKIWEPDQLAVDFLIERAALQQFYAIGKARNLVENYGSESNPGIWELDVDKFRITYTNDQKLLIAVQTTEPLELKADGENWLELDPDELITICNRFTIKREERLVQPINYLLENLGKLQGDGSRLWETERYQVSGDSGYLQVIRKSTSECILSVNSGVISNELTQRDIKIFNEGAKFLQQKIIERSQLQGSTKAKSPEMER